MGAAEKRNISYQTRGRGREGGKAGDLELSASTSELQDTRLGTGREISRQAMFGTALNHPALL